MAKEGEKSIINKFVKIVCPRPEELSFIVNNVRCEECGLSFSNEPRLRMHVLKIHEHKSLKKQIKEDVRYHCPEIMCVYALKSQRFFTTMKYLKQHYLKVHAAKTFACTQCDKSFSTEAVRLAHLRICGVQFTCSCLRIFGTYEALLTHAKRMAHRFDEKYKRTLVRKNQGKALSQTNLSQSASPRINKPVSILPHRANCTIPTTAIKIAFDVAVQTDEIKRHKRIQSPTKTWKRRESRETQTSLLSREKRARKTVETQTNQNARTTKSQKCHTVVKGKQERMMYANEKRFTTIEENFSSENLFPSSPLKLEHDVGLQDFWEDTKITLGTQTSPEKDFLEVFSDNVTQTDLVNFYSRQQADCLNLDGKTNVRAIGELSYHVESHETDCYSFNDRNRISRSDPMLTIDSFADRFNSIETQTEMANLTNEHFFDNGVTIAGRNFAVSSNNETQTTENFDNIEQLLYSNTCTQTCNDILPSDLGLSDIQTQTAWHELEDSTNSIETQTSNSYRNVDSTNISRSWLNTRISHTETQTDLLSIFEEF